MKRFIIFLVFSITALGCSHKTVQDVIDATTGIGTVEKKIESERQIAKIKCIELCRGAQREGIDLSPGPCIGNPIPNMETWVCDVSHSPRIDVDNEEKNQCATFREGKTKHFIEVDPQCNFIQSF